MSKSKLTNSGGMVSSNTSVASRADVVGIVLKAFPAISRTRFDVAEINVLLVLVARLVLLLIRLRSS